MTLRRLRVAAAMGLLFCVWPVTARPLLAGRPEMVTGVEIASPHELPTDLIRAAIGDATGRPLSRAAIRESLVRVWSLGLLSEVRVEEVATADGLHLRYHLVRRPFIRSVMWEGELGLPKVDLAEAAALALGGDAGPERLERAVHNVRAAYLRDGFFDARIDIQTQIDPTTNGRDVTFLLQAGPRARIGQVELGGLVEAEAARFRKPLRLNPGEEYSERTTRERAQWLEDALRQDGYFEARVHPAESTWDAASNQVTIRITVDRGEKYQVDFEGVQALKESVLRDRLGFKESGVVDDTEVSTNARELEAVHREAGYHFAKVSGTLVGNGERRTIRFEVVEGARVIVETIAISGNQTIRTADLTERMATRLPGLLRPGIFRQDVLDRDLVTVAAHYRSQGFQDVVVGPADVRFSDDRQRAQIGIPIREGRRLLVGQRTVAGATVLSPREILAAIPFGVGDPWTAQRSTEAQRAIGRLYAQQGFLNAQTTIEVTETEDGHVELVFRIHEGTPTRVGRILVSGLVATQENVVRREIPFKPGDPFSPELLVETERRLSRLGLFERIQVGPLRPPQTPFADVEVTVREGKPWRVEFGVGYGTDRGWRGLLELGHDNLFGTGRSASIRQRVSEDWGDRTDLTFRTPWLFEMPVQGDATLFREREQELGYKRQSAGIAAGVLRELSREPLSDIVRIRVGLRYQIERVRRYDIDPTLLAGGPDSIVEGSQIVARITPALILDHRDNLLDPGRGSLSTLSVDVAGPYLGSQVSFVRSRIETAWYLDWLAPVVIAVGARVGLAAPYGNSAALPIEDRFYAGGNSTVRGYEQDKIGPLDAGGNPTGGNGLTILNLEARFPVWRWVSGVAFVDSGAVVPEVGDLPSADFKTGVGGGMRIRTPVGPIRLDVGYALNSIPGDNRWQLYFGIGQAF
jgi:outer membrane protein insertion porin family